MGVSAGGTSAFSYSITLLSKQRVALYALTHKPQTPCCLVGFTTPPAAICLRKSSTHYLLDVLAPGPAQALEHMHCHVASFQSLQRVPELGHFLLTLSVSTAVFNSTPPPVELFWNSWIPPREDSGVERVQLDRPQTVRPGPPPPFPSSPALSAPGRFSVMSPVVT